MDDPNEELSELEMEWQNLQNIPSYFERFDPHQPVHLIIVQHCATCGHWHNADDGCPLLVEV